MAEDRATRQIGGTGSAALSYQLAPGLAQYVESVLVEVDTSGAGDTTATLSVATPDGIVMARKVQGQTIDGGGSGSATFALRLDDDGGGSGGAPLEVTDLVTFVLNVIEIIFKRDWFTVEDLGGGVVRIGPNLKLVGFDKTNSGTTLVASGTSTVQLKSDTIVRLTESSGRVDFSVQKSGAIGVVEATLNNSTDVYRVTDAGGSTVLSITGNGDAVLHLRTGKTFTVTDNAGAALVTYTG